MGSKPDLCDPESVEILEMEYFSLLILAFSEHLLKKILLFIIGYYKYRCL